MQTIDPAPATALVAICVGALMVHVPSASSPGGRGGRTVRGDGGRDAADDARRGA